MKTNLQKSPPAKGEVAFTPAEVLAAIAILGILVALPMPTLGKAKSRAVATHCLNDLSQLQLCWRMYLNDHNNFVPPNRSVAVKCQEDSTDDVYCKALRYPDDRWLNLPADRHIAEPWPCRGNRRASRKANGTQGKDRRNNRCDRSGLTKREREIAELAAEDQADKQIADALCISPATVNHHRRHILAKLRVHSRVAAVASLLLATADRLNRR